MSLLLEPGHRAARGIGSTVLALALAAIPSTAHAFCRTTTQPLPANYSPTRGCFKDGLLLYWRGACIGYSINRDASKNIPFADAQRVIDTAFSTWMNTTCAQTGERPGIDVANVGAVECDEVRYNNETPNQNLIVFRDSSWPYQDPNSTLGLTTVTFNSENGEIYDADLEINSSGRNLSTTDQVPANGFDLASVITHEAGHFLGLAHATDSKSTMFASYKPGTTALRSLTPDDVAGLCAIYPNATTRIVTKTAVQSESIVAGTCDPNPRHGLTTKCVTPLPREEKCSMSAVPVSPPACSTGAVLVVVGLLVVRRRSRPHVAGRLAPLRQVQVRART